MAASRPQLGAARLIDERAHNSQHGPAFIDCQWGVNQRDFALARLLRDVDLEAMGPRRILQGDGRGQEGRVAAACRLTQHRMI